MIVRARRWLIGVAAALGMVLVLAGLAWGSSLILAQGGVQLGFHGWLALTIALVGLTGMAGGLMWLAFYSARAGWDDIDREM